MKLRADKTVGFAIGQLREIKQALGTPRTANAHPTSRRYAEELATKILLYLNWVSRAERQIRDTFSDADLVDGLFGDRYWQIGKLTEHSSFAFGIVSDEIRYQEQRIAEAIQKLLEWRKLDRRSGELLILDVDALLACRPYDQIPWTALTGSARVRLVLTTPVIDALEIAKQCDNRHLKERAGQLLSRIDAGFGNSDAEFIQVEQDGRDAGEVTLEVLHDDPGYYQAGADSDEAILDRAEFLQQATGRAVSVVTTSTRLKLRSRVRTGKLKRFILPKEFRTEEDDLAALPVYAR